MRYGIGIGNGNGNGHMKTLVLNVSQVGMMVHDWYKCLSSEILKCAREA